MNDILPLLQYVFFFSVQISNKQVFELIKKYWHIVKHINSKILLSAKLNDLRNTKK